MFEPSSVPFWTAMAALAGTAGRGFNRDRTLRLATPAKEGTSARGIREYGETGNRSARHSTGALLGLDRQRRPSST